jgi:hypothetical protein
MVDKPIMSLAWQLERRWIYCVLHGSARHRIARQPAPQVTVQYNEDSGFGSDVQSSLNSILNQSGRTSNPTLAQFGLTPGPV